MTREHDGVSQETLREDRVPPLRVYYCLSQSRNALIFRSCMDVRFLLL